MMIDLRRMIIASMALFLIAGIASSQTDDIMTGLNESYDIKVVLDHIFISKKNNSLEISEIVVFRNEGAEIYYEKDNHTFFAISIPKEARNLETQAMECCLVQEDGMVYMDPMKSIRQGEDFEMRLSYSLTPKNSKYLFNKSTVYNTASLSMFIDKKSGLDLQGQMMNLEGNEYSVISFNDIKEKEMISIPIVIVNDAGYPYAGIGLVFLFLAGFIYRFRGKILQKNEIEFSIEELEHEKERIFHTIHGFEKHQVGESSDEFKKLIEENRQKAIRIIIKIDQIKNKPRSELKYG